jgi:hypothetical protein
VQQVKDYLVTWEIDIRADGPKAAACAAFELMQRPTTATVFTVTDEQGEQVQVDLEEEYRHDT